MVKKHNSHINKVEMSKALVTAGLQTCHCRHNDLLLEKVSNYTPCPIRLTSEGLLFPRGPILNPRK